MTHEKRKHAGRKGGSAPHLRRTHWPRGKRRNDPGPDWAAVRDRLRRTLMRRVRGEISTRQCAIACRRDERSLRRYLRGEDYPQANIVHLIRRWLRQRADGERR